MSRGLAQLIPVVIGSKSILGIGPRLAPAGRSPDQYSACSVSGCTRLLLTPLAQRSLPTWPGLPTPPAFTPRPIPAVFSPGWPVSNGRRDRRRSTAPNTRSASICFVPTIRSQHNAEGVCHLGSVMGRWVGYVGGRLHGRRSERSCRADRLWSAGGVGACGQCGCWSVRFQTSTRRRTAGSRVGRSRR